MTRWRAGRPWRTVCPRSTTFVRPEPRAVAPRLRVLRVATSCGLTISAISGRTSLRRATNSVTSGNEPELGRSRYNRYFRSGRDVGRHASYREAPRGVIATDTRSLRRDVWGQPDRIANRLVAVP